MTERPTTLAYGRAAVLAVGAGSVDCFYRVFSSRLSCLPFLMPHLLGDGWAFRNIMVSAVITQR